MTLIAAFRTSDGAVICADSQETLGNPTPEGFASYRCRVDKIGVKHGREYQFVLGGAGDTDLIEGLEEILTDAICSWPSGITDGDIKSNVLQLVLAFNRTEVAASGCEPPQFIVCIKRRNDASAPVLFRTGRAVVSIKDYALIGWEEGIYRHDVQRLFRKDAPTLPNVLLGIHLLLLASTTSNNVGPPIQIVVATDAGLSEVDRREVSELEERVEVFNQMLYEITLKLSDTSTPIEEFRDYVTEFRNHAVRLHDYYTTRTALDSFKRVLFDPDWKPDTVQQLPPDSVSTRTQEGDKKIAEFSHKFTMVDDLLEDN